MTQACCKMEETKLIKYERGLVQRVGDAISVTNKLLALAEPQLIPYRKKDKWGFCTPDKKIVIDYIYDCAYPQKSHKSRFRHYSTVTLFAKFLGLSTS